MIYIELKCIFIKTIVYCVINIFLINYVFIIIFITHYLPILFIFIFIFIHLIHYLRSHHNLWIIFLIYLFIILINPNWDMF